jgi:hypothetical protein
MVHEPRLWQGLAPATPQIRRYVAVDHLCRERLVSDCNLLEQAIQIIPNGVDLEKFRTRATLPDKPGRALIFTSGAPHNRHLELAGNVCRHLGIHLDEAGHAAGKGIEHPEEVLPGYDLVFAKARCALEALSVGCAVILIGPEGVGEMVSSSRFDHLRSMNFGMGLLTLNLTEESLLSQIERYDARDAEQVSRRVRDECGVEHTVTALEALHAEVASLKNKDVAGPTMVSLKVAAHIADEVTKEAVRLAHEAASLTKAAASLTANLQLAREIASKSSSDLEKQRSRAEHYRSKVQELRARLKNKRVAVGETDHSRTLFRPPSALRALGRSWRRLWQANPTHPPMPFIVGSPRSGTTMLRLMLDAHPQVAIPPETGFVAPLSEVGKENYAGSESFWQLLTGHPHSEASTWPDFHLQKQELRDALEKVHPFNPADGLRTFYRLYAARFNKRRYGDKTPSYARHMTAIEALLPEAHFIHLVRDGRDAAISLRKLWFSPGNTMTEQAVFWRDNVLTAREQGGKVQHYLEVSYENLVRDPKRVLLEICNFIELPFSKKMLEYHRQAQARLNEHEGRLNKEGTVVLSKEMRLNQQSNSGRPPRQDIVGKWQNELSPAEVAEFEAVAGAALRLFGYKVGR